MATSATRSGCELREDTDCTGATSARSWASHGATAIPAKWRDPVSEGIAVGWGIVGLDYPTDLEELTRQTIAQTERVLAAKAPQVRIVDQDTVAEYDIESLKAPELMSEVEAADPMTASYDLGPVALQVAYGQMPTIGYDAPAEVRLTLGSRADVAVAASSVQARTDGRPPAQASSRWAAGALRRSSHAASGLTASVKPQVTNPITVRIALEDQDPITIASRAAVAPG